MLFDKNQKQIFATLICISNDVFSFLFLLPFFHLGKPLDMRVQLQLARKSYAKVLLHLLDPYFFSLTRSRNVCNHSILWQFIFPNMCKIEHEKKFHIIAISAISN